MGVAAVIGEFRFFFRGGQDHDIFQLSLARAFLQGNKFLFVQLSQVNSPGFSHRCGSGKSDLAFTRRRRRQSPGRLSNSSPWRGAESRFRRLPNKAKQKTARRRTPEKMIFRFGMFPPSPRNFPPAAVYFIDVN